MEAPILILHGLINGECIVVNVFGLLVLALCVGYGLREAVYIPFKIYFLAQKLPGIDLRKMGRWAVVTGATDGIGKGYAVALAERGLDIVLISRTQDKLDKVANEIKAEHGVQVETIAVDFTHTDIYKKIEKGLQGLDIAILVNNVGMANVISTFLNTPNLISTTSDMVNVNCVSVTNMCALVLPHMLEKKKGVIVNISSMSANGFIGFSTYSATKAYVSMFSECLQRTYRDSGLIIQTLEPGFVTTVMADSSFPVGRSPFMDVGKKYFSVPTSIYVNTALNTIGWTERTNGHFKHFFGGLLGRIQSKSSQDNLLLADLQKSESQ